MRFLLASLLLFLPMCPIGCVLAVDTPAEKVKLCWGSTKLSVVVKGTYTAEALAIDTTHKLPTKPSEKHDREE